MITGSVRVVLAGAQPAADFEARDARQHPVENDEIGRVFGQAQLGLVAALHALDDVALRLEIVGQQHREIGFVLDHQDARSRRRAGADGLLARLVHSSSPAASMSMSVSCRPRGRSDGIVWPVTR